MLFLKKIIISSSNLDTHESPIGRIHFVPSRHHDMLNIHMKGKELKRPQCHIDLEKKIQKSRQPMKQ